MGVGGAIAPVWCGERPKWFPEEFHWIVGCSYRGMPRTPAAVRNLFGCNMSFRREAFDALGGFRLGYGCDETEFCIRLQQRWPHKVVLYNPRSRGRPWQLPAACDILAEHRTPTTPVGVVTDAGRPSQAVRLTTLAAFDHDNVGMTTCVVIGSSTTTVVAGRMVTPRGYAS